MNMCMIRPSLVIGVLAPIMTMMLGCATTTPPRQNPALAPPLSTPSPLAPGQVPTSAPVTAPQQQQPTIPLPPSSSPEMSGAPLTTNTPEHARVQTVAARLYQANPWIRIKPQWIVRPGDMPGITHQGDQYGVISEGLVRSASEGQLAAIMSLQLADMAAARQRSIADVERTQRRTTAFPDFYQPRDGASSAQANLEMAETAKHFHDRRDVRRTTQQEPPIDPPTFARQVLIQAGYAPQELETTAPLLQRFPPVQPARR